MSVWLTAVCNGHLNILRHIDFTTIFVQDQRLLMLNAALNGELDCIRILREKKCHFDVKSCMYAAASRGHLDCLEYLHLNGAVMDSRVCEEAATYGHLNCLTYAHENGAVMTAKVCEGAASNGHLDCLKYAINNRAPCDKSVIIAAVEGNHLDCLIYAHQSGCPFDVIKLYETASRSLHYRPSNYINYINDTMASSGAGESTIEVPDAVSGIRND